MSFLGHLRARKIWIDDALGDAARCRLSALRQRGITAFGVEAAVYGDDLEAIFEENGGRSSTNRSFEFFPIMAGTGLKVIE